MHKKLNILLATIFLPCLVGCQQTLEDTGAKNTLQFNKPHLVLSHIQKTSIEAASIKNMKAYINDYIDFSNTTPEARLKLTVRTLFQCADKTYQNFDKRISPLPERLYLHSLLRVNEYQQIIKNNSIKCDLTLLVENTEEKNYALQVKDLNISFNDELYGKEVFPKESITPFNEFTFTKDKNLNNSTSQLICENISYKPSVAAPEVNQVKYTNIVKTLKTNSYQKCRLLYEDQNNIKTFSTEFHIQFPPPRGSALHFIENRHLLFPPFKSRSTGHINIYNHENYPIQVRVPKKLVSALELLHLSTVKYFFTDIDTQPKHTTHNDRHYYYSQIHPKDSLHIKFHTSTHRNFKGEPIYPSIQPRSGDHNAMAQIKLLTPRESDTIDIKIGGHWVPWSMPFSSSDFKPSKPTNVIDTFFTIKENQQKRRTFEAKYKRPHK